MRKRDVQEGADYALAARAADRDRWRAERVTVLQTAKVAAIGSAPAVRVRTERGVAVDVRAAGLWMTWDEFERARAQHQEQVGEAGRRAERAHARLADAGMGTLAQAYRGRGRNATQVMYKVHADLLAPMVADYRKSQGLDPFKVPPRSWFQSRAFALIEALAELSLGPAWERDDRVVVVPERSFETLLRAHRPDLLPEPSPRRSWADRLARA